MVTFAEHELAVLLADYQALRDDERATTNSQAALASVFVALLAGLFAILVGDCRFRGVGAAAARSSGSCYELAEPVYVVAPALPFAVLSYIVMLGTVVTLKSFYMRAIENELRRFVSRPMTVIPEVTGASATELMLAVTSPRRGSRAYLALLVYLVLTFVVALVGWSVFVSLQLGAGARIAMLVLYGPLLLLIARQGFLINTGGRTLLRRAAKNLATTDYPTMSAIMPTLPKRAPDERPTWSYLLLPRPQDLIKWFFVPVAYSIGLLLADTDSSVSLPYAALGWLVFEYLVYQARYQWNDIRGLTDDLAHPARSERRRLPVTALGERKAVALSGLVILTKMALAAVIALNVPSLTAAVLVSGGCAWAVAFAYERLRNGTSQSIVRAIAIWLVVGVGYAVRTAFGLTLAGVSPGERTLWPFIALVVAAWSFGVVFVTLTWVIEATGHCCGGPDPLLYPRTLRTKPHLFHLLRFTGLRLRPAGTSAPPEALDVKPIAQRAPLWSPWNAGLVLSVAIAVAGCMRTGWTAAAITALAIVATIGVVVTPTPESRLVTTGVSLVVVVPATGALVNWTSALAVGLVLLIFLGVYAGFRQSCYADFRYFLRNLVIMLRGAGTWADTSVRTVLRWLVGRRTWQLLTASGRRSPPPSP